jgi:hypothetical protein
VLAGARGEVVRYARPMARVVLHVGMHKTGTTLIQQFLHAAQDDLRRHGINYVRSGRTPVPPNPKGWDAAHHLLAWRSTGQGAQAVDLTAWDPVLDEITSGAPEQVHVISAEDFCLATDEQTRAVKAVLQDHDVQIVMYDRDPAGLMLSQYKQLVASRISFCTKTFGEFIDQPDGIVDFTALAERWRAAFGSDAVTTRSYDDAVAGRGLVADFCDAIGLDPATVDLDGSTKKVNASRSDPQVQAARVLNHTVDWPVVGPVTRRLRRVAIRPGASAKQRAILLALYPWTRRPVATDADLQRLAAATSHS